MRTRARAVAALAAGAAALAMVAPASAAQTAPSGSREPAERAPGASAGRAAELLREAVGPRSRPAGTLRVDPTAADAVPGVLLVTTTGREATDRVRGAATARVAGASAKAVGKRVARVDVAPGSERAAAALLAAQPGVVAVEQARYRKHLAVPSDRLYDQQWAHQLTDAERAWDVTTGNDLISVAVLDSGVDGTHPDLRNLVEQRTFAGGSSRSVPRYSDNRQCEGDDHGTHVAGIVGAQGNDAFGVAGVAWDVALLDFAVFTPTRNGCGASDADVLAAIDAASLAGVDVINMSLGGPSDACSTAFQAAIDDARAAGTVVVAASGNAEEVAPGQTSIPASCNGVISVGAVTVSGTHASYSTANAYVDIAAPGGDSRTGFADGVLSTVGGGGHDWFEGTSMASPYVAGLAALLRAVDPRLTPDQVEGLIEAGAVDKGTAGRDRLYGRGLVNAGASVTMARSGARPAPDTDPDFPVGGSGGGIQPPPNEPPQVFRISQGTGRTFPVPQAVAMSRATFEDDGAAHAVIARKDVFADALAGSSLGLGFGPLLFTASTGRLQVETRDELLRTLPPGATVYLLGGASALPTTLEGELQALGFRPVRLQGQTREATAVAVSNEVARRRAELRVPDERVVMLATGANWPDAVAGGSLGAFYGIPILVTPTASLHPATAQQLRTLRPEVLLVLGGPAAVSDATYNAAASAAGTGADRTARVAGSDRYGTAVAIADLFESVLAGSGTMPRCVIAANVVRADGWAHVLSASAPAGAFGCVIVPVEGPTGTRLPAVARGYVQGFGIDGVLAGDVDVISNAAAAELEALLQP